MAQDSSKPDFWETRYRDRLMPWDAGEVPRALVEFVPRLKAGTRILVPGCGSAYEAGYLAHKGMEVLAIDFSPAAVDEARKHVARYPHILQLADFFEYEYGQLWDVVYERAFLCALPPRMWDQYGLRMAQIIKSGGLLAGFFFFADTPRGPPFGIVPDHLERLLSSHFERITDEAVTDSIPVFVGKERWQVWRRRGEASASP